VTERVWQQNPPYQASFQSDPNNPYVLREFISLANAAGTLVTTSAKKFNQDKNGNVLRVEEYDWVPYNTVHDGNGNLTGALPAATALKRVTINAYNNGTQDATATPVDDPNVYYRPGRRP